GCVLYQAIINLTHFNEPVITTARIAAKAKDDAYQAAKGPKAAAVAAHASRIIDARTLITVCRDVLKPRLGKRWSPAWAVTGFTTRLQIPSSSADLLPLLESLETYFTANPTHEVADLGATAAAAHTLHEQLSAARTTANACDADVALKKAERDAELKKLRNCGRGLLAELKTLIAGDDGRWRAFGFNPPSAVGLPEVPEGLEVIGSMAQHLFATWESAPLADRYRLYRQIVGVDADFVLVKTVTETESDLNTFTSGQVVRVRVTAVNDAGESLMSEIVEVTVP
ncbi:MAG TPA: fibronectin type III domain-containing protein, partial [Verrucomicrobiae bacterium]